MGSAIARNLLRAGHELAVYNRTREKAEALKHDGARVAGSPGQACLDAEAVFTMVSDDQALAQVVFGSDGIASALGSGAVHISSSTISVGFAKQLAAEHASKGQKHIAAPVFGRPEAAENKKLIVVTAGEGESIDRCQPLFDAIGRQTFQVGPEPWHANLVKLCGNFMIASMLETFSETFVMMRKAHIDHHLFLDVMNELFGSPVYKNYGRIIADERFEPAAFTLKLGLKDIRQVIDAAQEFNAPMPFASLLRDHLISGAAQGQEDLDWSSIARVAAHSAGL